MKKVLGVLGAAIVALALVSCGSTSGAEEEGTAGGGGIVGKKVITTIGPKNKSAGWWTAFGNYYLMPPESTLKVSFTNYSDKINQWDNFVVVYTTDANRQAAGYQEFMVLRADQFGWGDNFDPENLTGEGFGDMNAFVSDMDGAECEVVIKREGALVTISTTATAANGNVYTQELSANCGDGTQVQRAFLTVEKGYLDNVTYEFIEAAAEEEVAEEEAAEEEVEETAEEAEAAEEEASEEAAAEEASEEAAEEEAVEE